MILLLLKDGVKMDFLELKWLMELDCVELMLILHILFENHYIICFEYIFFSILMIYFFLTN